MRPRRPRVNRTAARLDNDASAPYDPAPPAVPEW